MRCCRPRLLCSFFRSSLTPDGQSCDATQASFRLDRNTAQAAQNRAFASSKAVPAVHSVVIPDRSRNAHCQGTFRRIAGTAANRPDMNIGASRNRVSPHPQLSGRRPAPFNVQPQRHVCSLAGVLPSLGFHRLEFREKLTWTDRVR